MGKILVKEPDRASWLFWPGFPGRSCHGDSKASEERTTKSGGWMLLQDQEDNALLLRFDKDWVTE